MTGVGDFQVTITLRYFAGLIGVLVAFGCGEKEEVSGTASPQPKDANAANTAEDTKKEPKNAAPGPIVFETITNDTMGFSVKVPKGAKNLGCEGRCTFSLPDSDGVFEHNVSVTDIDYSVKDLESATRTVMLIRENITSKESLDNGDFLIKTAGGLSKDVHYFARGSAGFVWAVCSAPPNQEKDALTMCSSLKNTK